MYFTGQPSILALHYELTHLNQYLKAIFSFPRETRSLSIFSQHKSDRVGMAQVQIEKSLISTPILTHTCTQAYRCPCTFAHTLQLGIFSHLFTFLSLYTTTFHLLPPSPYPLSLQVSHLLIQFSLINSTCINFGKSSPTTVTLGSLFCYISPTGFECHISCGVRTCTLTCTPWCQSTDVSS